MEIFSFSLSPKVLRQNISPWVPNVIPLYREEWKSDSVTRFTLNLADTSLSHYWYLSGISNLGWSIPKIISLILMLKTMAKALVVDLPG